MLLESFWAAGWLIAALIAYFVIPTMVGELHLIITALPAFYAIYLRRKLPDSPKFKEDGKPKQSIGSKMKELWSKKYARRTLMLWIVWFTVVFSYYGMFLWLPSVMVLKGFSMINSFGYVLIMTLAQLPGYFTAAWLIERAGRKFVLATYLLGTAASALAFGNAETLAMLLRLVHCYPSSIWVLGVLCMPIHQSNTRQPFVQQVQEWRQQSDVSAVFLDRYSSVHCWQLAMDLV